MKSNRFQILAVCIAIVACVAYASPVMAQGRGNGNGGGGGGGGGEDPVEVPIHYRITQIGELGGNLEAYDVNAAGTVVGSFYPAGYQEAFVWSVDSGLTNLNDIATILVDGQVSTGWRLASARGINEAGQIGGNAQEIATGLGVAFRYDPNTGNAELMPTFSQENYLCAWKDPINELGDLAYYGNGSNGSKIVYVDSSIGFFEYAFPGTVGTVNGINNVGQVFGGSYILELGNAPEDDATLNDYTGVASVSQVNDFGQFTGILYSGNEYRAYRFDPATISFEVLDSRRKGNSRGDLINLPGDVCGYFWDRSYADSNRPVLKTDEHGTINLYDAVNTPENDLTLWDPETLGGYTLQLIDMTNRDSSGFPMILTNRSYEIDGVISKIAFLLEPISE